MLGHDTRSKLPTTRRDRKQSTAQGVVLSLQVARSSRVRRQGVVKWRTARVDETKMRATVQKSQRTHLARRDPVGEEAREGQHWTGRRGW